MAALEDALPEVLAADLAGMEQRLRQVGRVVVGAVVARVVAAQAATVQRGVCPACAGCLPSVDQARARHLHGVVGAYCFCFHRAY
jgi:hypothetical protein